MEHHHFDQCIMIINSQVITGQTKVIPACMWAVLQALNIPWGCTAESLRLWTCSRQFTRICDPVPDNEQKKNVHFFCCHAFAYVFVKFYLGMHWAWLRTQLNRSTMATLGTEEIAVVERFKLESLYGLSVAVSGGSTVNRDYGEKIYPITEPN